MIGIVTLNPCVDKTLFVDSLPSMGIHTADRVTCIAGGKGNNVSRVLGSLGVERKSLVMIAGESGAHICRLMSLEGIPAQFITAPGMSRTITTIVDNNWNQLAIKEVGPQLDVENANKIIQEFKRFLKTIDFLCLSGTISCPSLYSFPKIAIGLAKEQGIPVLLDTDGPALEQGLLASPNIVKPNDAEISDALSIALENTDAEKACINRMLDMGIEHPIISLGERGCLTSDKGIIYKILPPRINTINPVGSGDSFVAGLLYGITNKMSWKDSLRWATAAGASNAAKWEAACLKMEEIVPLVNSVQIIQC